MTQSDERDEEARASAAVAAAVAAQGLERAMAQFPDDVRNAATRARTLAAGLPRDLLPAEEPAHVYRARPPKGGRDGTRNGAR